MEFESIKRKKPVKDFYCSVFRKKLRNGFAILMAAVILLTGFPLDGFSAFASETAAESRDEEVAAYAEQEYQKKTYGLRFWLEENVAFRTLMRKLYSGREEDANSLEKAWGWLNSKALDALIELVTDEKHTVVNPNEELEDILFYAEMMQVLMEYSRLSFDDAWERAKKDFKSNTILESVLSLAKDWAFCRVSPDSLVGDFIFIEMSNLICWLEEKNLNTGSSWLTIIYCVFCRYRQFQYTSSSISFFQMIGTYAKDERLRKAADAMAVVYTEWQAELETMDYSDADLEALSSDEYYTEKQETWVQKRLADYMERVYGSDLGFWAREVYLMLRSTVLNPLEDIVYLGVGLSDLTYNADALYEAVRNMKCLSFIAEAMECYGKEQGENLGSDWNDYISYYDNYILYLKVCAMGEANLYHLLTRETVIGIICKWIIKDDVEDWYKQEKTDMTFAYNLAQFSISDIYKKYQESFIGETDVSAVSGTDVSLLRTVSGTLTHDEFYASREDASKPDPEYEDPEKGSPAAGVSVRLVGKNTGTVYAEDFTDEEGNYELTYIQDAVSGDPLKLVIAEECRNAMFAPKETDIWFDSEFRYRGSYASAAAPAYGSDEPTLSAAFEYCDQLFLQPSSYYYQELARISLGLCVAAYSDPSADANWTQNGSFGRENNIRDALSLLGFGDSDYPMIHKNYDVQLNDASSKVAFTIAAKDITNPAISMLEDPEKKEHLVAVVLRGGGYGDEWSDNFNVGTGNYHAGFNGAANMVTETVADYIKNQFTDGRPVKLWLTGYSRSAATANLVAEKLDAMNVTDDLFAYTFATPSGTKNPVAVRGLYNIVYENDLVPRVAPAAWGFGKNGETRVFSASRSGLNDEQKERISGQFKRLIQYGDFIYDPDDYETSSSLIRDAMEALAEVIPDTETYHETLEPYVRAITLMAFSKFPDGNGNDLKWGEKIYEANKMMRELISEEIDGNYREFIAEAIPLILYQIKYEGEFALFENSISSKLVPILTNPAVYYPLKAIYEVMDSFIRKLVECEDFLETWFEAYVNCLVYAQILKGDDATNMDELNDELTDCLIRIVFSVLEAAGVLDDLLLESGSFSAAGTGHTPEIYLSWLMALTGEEMFGDAEKVRIDIPLLQMQGIPHGRISLSKWNGEGFDMVNGLHSRNVQVFGSDVSDRWMLLRGYYNETTDLLMALPASILPEGEKWEELEITEGFIAQAMETCPYVSVSRCNMLLEDGEYRYRDTTSGREFWERDRRQVLWTIGMDGKLYVWVTDEYGNYMGPEGRWWEWWFYTTGDQPQMTAFTPDLKKAVFDVPSSMTSEGGFDYHIWTYALDDVDVEYDEKSGLWCFAAFLWGYGENGTVNNMVKTLFTIDNGNIVTVARFFLDNEFERFWPR